MQTNRLLWLLGGIFLAVSLFFLTFNANGNWEFVLRFRGEKWLMLVTIGYTIGVSTLLFQTLTNNSILTPSILGFDSLYLLLQTSLIFLLGGVGFTQLGAVEKFAFESALMLGGALLLFRTLTQNSDLARMILVGVIFGVLFRSLNNLLQRMIDPTEFAVTQGSSFAQFNTVNSQILWIGVAIAAASSLWIWRQRHKLDVLLLGRDRAISLGLDYPRFSKQILICCALLVAVSTALVGPILFLGLLVCAIANQICVKVHHAVRIPVSFFIAAITLIAGQAIFEQVLKLQGVLSVVIEFLGGLVFIYLILHRRKSL